MGRRDAVQVILEVVAECRRLLPSLIVTYEPGWERRGNGYAADYMGGIVHHTASHSSQARPYPTQTILRDGRAGLSGPLCNFGGPWCTVEAPRLHVVAAFPANHAGASGGRSMGPLPVTSLFNPKVLGLEIDYSGTVPMTAGQLLVGHVWTRAVANVLARGNVEYVRAHFESSTSGKWDPGHAPGKSYNMADWRRAAATLSAASPPRGFLDMLTDAQQDELYRWTKQIVTELMGPDYLKTGKDHVMGWPVRRAGATAVERQTVIGMLGSVWAETFGQLQRSTPGKAADTPYGQILSTRARVEEIAKVLNGPAQVSSAGEVTLVLSDSDKADIARLVLDGLAGRLEA